MLFFTDDVLNTPIICRVPDCSRPIFTACSKCSSALCHTHRDYSKCCDVALDPSRLPGSSSLSFLSPLLPHSLAHSHILLLPLLLSLLALPVSLPRTRLCSSHKHTHRFTTSCSSRVGSCSVSFYAAIFSVLFRKYFSSHILVSTFRASLHPTDNFDDAHLAPVLSEHSHTHTRNDLGCTGLGGPARVGKDVSSL